MSKIRCYNCIQFGHFAKNCKKPPNKNWQRNKHHASTAAEEEEPQRKKSRAETIDQEQRECYMVSSLLGSVSNSTDSRWIDSGVSKHMTGFRKVLINFKDKKFNVKVKMGDNSTYAIRGIGSTSF